LQLRLLLLLLQQKHSLLLLLLLPDLHLDLLGGERRGGLGPSGRFSLLLRRERICGAASGLLLLEEPLGRFVGGGLGRGLGLLAGQRRGSPL